MEKTEKNIKKKSEKCNVKESNLRKYITVQIQSVVDNGVEINTNLMRVCVSEKVSLSLAPL